MIEAEDAPTDFMAEKIKKFAKMARSMDRTIRDKFVFPEESNVFIELWSKKTIGNITIAAIKESTNTNVIGDVPWRILWSIV